MVNFGFNSASVLGIVLILAGAGLYLMRSLKPDVSRDHDIFFAAVSLLCGFILFFQGWRLDPILQFSQLLLAGSAIFFAVESVRLRGVTTTQVRSRTSSYVDNDRGASRVYRAELDQIEGYEEDYDYEEDEAQPPRRRLQGTAPKSPSRRSNYEDETPRSRRSRPSQQPPTSRRPTNYPSRPSRRNQYEDWEETPDHWEDETPTSRRPPSRPSNESPRRRPPSPRRPKSADDIVSSVGTEYVDYQPLDDEGEDINDRPDNKPNPDNFDY